NILRSESTGSIHIASKTPNQPPAIRFNFMSAQLDREVTLEAMRITRRIMTAPAMRGIATDEIAPGVTVQSDDELLDWVKHNAETTYHPVGTCKMGSDPMAVVDDQLRVRGITGLRVADASIMPTLTSGNTNAPSIMIGEKASRMALQAAAGAVRRPPLRGKLATNANDMRRMQAHSSRREYERRINRVIDHV